MTRATVAVCLSAQCAILTATLAAQELGIHHKAVGCVVAGQHPLLTARVVPSERVARARAYFRAHGTPHWYFVEMRGEVGAYVGTLPPPKKELERIDYYIEAMDSAFVGNRTADFAPRVVGNAGECRKDLLVAGATPTAKVLVGAPSGAPAMPVGFSTTGVTSLGVSGAAVAPYGASAAPIAAAASSGLSTGLILGGVAVAGGATAGVLLATKGGDEKEEEACLAQPGELFEIGLVCGDINLKARAGCPMTLQQGVGRWSSAAVAERMLANAVGVITVDGAALPVTYEGITLHQGGGEPDGYGNRARAVWTPTVGTHTLSGYWSLSANDVSRCVCSVTR